MLLNSTHVHFSEVCSKVSCWAIFLSVIIPPSHVLGFQVVYSTTPSPSLHPSLHSPLSDYHPSSVCFLNLYLESFFDQCPANTPSRRHNCTQSKNHHKTLVKIQQGKHLASTTQCDSISRRSSTHSLQNSDQSIVTRDNKRRRSNPKLSPTNNPQLNNNHLLQKRATVFVKRSESCQLGCEFFTQSQSFDELSASFQLEFNHSQLANVVKPFASKSEMKELSLSAHTYLTLATNEYFRSDIDKGSVDVKDKSIPHCKSSHEQVANTRATPETISSTPATLETSLHHNSIQISSMDSTVQRFVKQICTFRLMDLVQNATLLARNDSITGKLVMILMSTICGIGVGMFGALLFVVALKVRILQSKGWGQQQQRQQIGIPSHHAVVRQQLHENMCKRVIPRGILDSFEIQTVNPKSSLSAENSGCHSRDTSKSDFTKGLAGFRHRPEGILSRESSYNHDVPNVHDIEEEEMVDSNNAYGWDSSSEDEDIIETEGYFGNITSFTKRGSYRRVSHSRRRHSNQCMSQEKASLPFANANAQTMCSICLSEYEVGEQVRTLPCYHKYHTSCIDPWLLQVTSLCPICKRDLLPGTGTL